MAQPNSKSLAAAGSSSNYSIPDFAPPALGPARSSPHTLGVSRSNANLRSSSSSPVRAVRMPSFSHEARRRDSLALSNSDESTTVRGGGANANASRSTLASSAATHSPRRLPDESTANLLPPPPARSAASLPQRTAAREVTFAESVEHAPMPPPFSEGDARVETESLLEPRPLRAGRLRDQLALRVRAAEVPERHAPLTTLPPARLAHRWCVRGTKRSHAPR